MSDKSCPNCGHTMTFGEYVRTTSLRFQCRQCGVDLRADSRRVLLASLVAAVPLGLAVSQAMDEPAWWFGVAAALGFLFVVHYWLLGVDLVRDQRASGSRG